MIFYLLGGVVTFQMGNYKLTRKKSMVLNARKETFGIKDLNHP